MERSFVMLKTDALQRGLVGEIIKRFEQKGLRLVGIKMLQMSDDLLIQHYSHLVDKHFFPEIREYLSYLPVIATCWEGVDCVSVARTIVGEKTNAREALPGTIRGDLAMSVQANLVHRSDSVEDAQVEIERFFAEDETFFFDLAVTKFMYSTSERSGL